jgi:hypothetical protein
MNLRTLIVAASLTLALAAPAAADAGSVRTPIFDGGLSSTSQAKGGAHKATGTNTATLERQLRAAKLRAARLEAKLRTAKLGNAKLRAELRAVKRLVADLRSELARTRAVDPPVFRPTPPTQAVGSCPDDPQFCGIPWEACYYWSLECDVSETPQGSAEQAGEQSSEPASEQSPAAESSESSSTEPGSADETVLSSTVDLDPFGYGEEC